MDHIASLALSPGRRNAITVLAMGATMMYILDSTIANVALPHMQAALGASQDSVAWILTSYIVAAAIATPLTGWLEGRFGRRTLFIAAIAGFTLSSAACGLAPNLEAVVAARVLQGIFGAFISPMSQSIMLDIYPRTQHAKAMTIWGMGVMIGPILGPLLGGWLTDRFDWRWVFFINVPVGIAVLTALIGLLPAVKVARRPFDMTGFLLIALFLSAMQLMLDRGTQLDWFDSPEIIIEAGVFVAALWMFVIHSATARHPLIPLALFRDRNFMIASVALMVVSGLIIGGATLIAPLLQRIMGYGVVDAGLLIAPRGASMALAMLMVGRLAGRVDARIVVGTGLALVVWAQHILTGISVEMDSSLIIWSGVIQGAGFGLVVLPLNLIAFATLAPHLRTEAAAFYSLARTIGGSIAISTMTALLARNLQVSHSDLSVHVTAVTFPFLESGLIERMGLRGTALAQFVDLEINRQAMMIAYIDDFWVTTMAATVVLPLVLLLRGAKAGKGDVPHVAME